MAASDIIKIKSRPGGRVCAFYDEATAACRVYTYRPAECRALNCRDTRDIETIYEKERLTRRDLLEGVSANTMIGRRYATLLRLHDAGHRLVLVSLAEAPPDPLVSEQILTYHLPDAASPYSPVQTRAAWQLSARSRRESVLAAWATGAQVPEEEMEASR